MARSASWNIVYLLLGLVIASVWICQATLARMSDILEANHLVLEDIKADLSGGTVENSKLEGRIILQPGARIVNSVVRGPAIIGENTEVIDSYIGPYTSIYYDCRIVDVGTSATNLRPRLIQTGLGSVVKLPF